MVEGAGAGREQARGRMALDAGQGLRLYARVGVRKSCRMGHREQGPGWRGGQPGSVSPGAAERKVPRTQSVPETVGRSEGAGRCLEEGLREELEALRGPAECW